jgi:hypothetical protein
MSVELRDQSTETVAARPLIPASPARAGTRPRGLAAADVAVVLALIGLAYSLAQAASLWSAPLATHVEIDLSPSALPGYALASVVRMAAAYLLSLALNARTAESDPAQVYSCRRLAGRHAASMATVAASCTHASSDPGRETTSRWPSARQSAGACSLPSTPRPHG